MIALAVMVLAAGAMTAVYNYSQKEEEKQQENVADKDAGKDKGNKKEDGASDDFVATLPKAEEETSEKLAEAVFAAVPVKEKNVKRIEERTERDDGDIYLVGFWTDRGTASSEILDLLGNLHGKKVALFGTCGMVYSLRKQESRTATGRICM